MLEHFGVLFCIFFYSLPHRTEAYRAAVLEYRFHHRSGTQVPCQFHRVRGCGNEGTHARGYSLRIELPSTLAGKESLCCATLTAANRTT